MWNMPWTPPFGADWVSSQEGGSSRHYAEPRHSTLALTEEAVRIMEHHHASSSSSPSPLFLYLSYNAAHSPLQPEPEWEEQCRHVPHLWRRQYCAMVVGLDQAVARVAEAARASLGPDTLLVLTSDNGGSVFFGGLNAPLRSGKHTSFEVDINHSSWIYLDIYQYIYRAECGCQRLPWT